MRYTKFLGIIIDEHLDWSEHIRLCSTKVTSALFALRSVRPCLSEEITKQLYYTLVYPHISNGIPLWGPTCKTPLNSLIIGQMKAIRIIDKACPTDHASPLLKKTRNNPVETII